MEPAIVALAASYLALVAAARGWQLFRYFVESF